MPFTEDSMDCIEGVQDLARAMRSRQLGRAYSRIVAAESEHGPSAHHATDRINVKDVQSDC